MGGNGFTAWIYVLSNAAMPELLKIGFSRKHPTWRALELQTMGVPEAFKLEYWAEITAEYERNLYKIEKIIHSTLGPFHYNKEFFKCSVEQARKTIQEVTKSCRTKEWPEVGKCPWEKECSLLARSLQGMIDSLPNVGISDQQRKGTIDLCHSLVYINNEIEKRINESEIPYCFFTRYTVCNDNRRKEAIEFKTFQEEEERQQEEQKRELEEEQERQEREEEREKNKQAREEYNSLLEERRKRPLTRFCFWTALISSGLVPTLCSVAKTDAESLVGMAFFLAAWILWAGWWEARKLPEPKEEEIKKLDVFKSIKEKKTENSHREEMSPFEKWQKEWDSFNYYWEKQKRRRSE